MSLMSNRVDTHTNGNISYRGTTYTREELWEKYREVNDGGHGFSVGEPTDSTHEAVIREGWEAVARLDDHDDSILAIDAGGDLVVVADHAEGPWGVRVVA